jgi:ankyrin repeat protein
MWAAMQGHLRACEALLASGAQLAPRDSLGASALLLAAQHAQPLTWLLLCERGGDAWQVDGRGCTAAHWAAYCGDVLLLRVLAARELRVRALRGARGAPGALGAVKA